MKLLLVLLFCPVLLFAQQPTELQFIDGKTRLPVEGVSLEIKNNSTFYQSAGDGRITIAFKATEEKTPVSVIASALGYQTDSLYIYPSVTRIITLNPKPLNLEQVTVYAASGMQKTTQLISKIDLALRPVSSSQQLLQLVPGLFIAQHQGGGKAEQLFLRGFDIDHGTDVAISVDGLPVNMVSHAHGQGYADLHFLIPETVKNIDFGAGLYNTTQGNFATAGYIQFETQDHLTENRIQLEAGSFNTYRALAMYQFPLKNNLKENAYFAGEYLYSDGPFKSAQHFNRFNLFTKYNRQITKKTALTIAASTFSSRWNASGQVPERAINTGLIDRFGSIDDNEGGHTQRSSINLALKTRLKNGVSCNNRFYAIRYGFNLFSNFTFFLNDPINGDQIRQHENRAVFGYQGNLSLPHHSKQNSNTQVGWGFRADRTNGSGLSHTIRRNTILEEIKHGDIHETNYFSSFNHSITHRKWQINSGSRLDVFHFFYKNRLEATTPATYRAIVSPKISIDYRYNKNLLFFAKGGKGFHSNDTRVVIQKIKETLPAAWGADAGITLKPLRGILLTATAWYLYLQQEFIYVGDEGVVEAGGRTKRTGVDVALRCQLTPKLFTSVNYNRAVAKDIDAAKGEQYIPLAPGTTATGSISYKDDKRFEAGIYIRYMGSRPANASNTVTAKDYTITDVAVKWRVKKFTLGIAAENLLDKKWNEAQFETTSRLKDEPSPVTELHFTPGAPFSLKLKVGLRF
jgi:hypothetical protein